MWDSHETVMTLVWCSIPKGVGSFTGKADRSRPDPSCILLRMCPKSEINVHVGWFVSVRRIEKEPVRSGPKGRPATPSVYTVHARIFHQAEKSAKPGDRRKGLSVLRKVNFPPPL